MSERLCNGGGGVAQGSLSGNFGEAEVEQFDSGLRNHDVVRLEVPVDYALDVRGVEGISRLRGILQGCLKREWPTERAAFEVLHDEIVGTDIEQGTDVRMIQRSD